MEALKARGLSFTYPGREESSLKDINLSIEEGEFVCLCGSTGSGKSSLLRMFKPSIAPHGEVKGACQVKVTEDETIKDVNQLSEREEAAGIGFVLQNPANQLVSDKVWHELAFGLENLGVEQDEIRNRVAEMASFFGIQGWFEKDVKDLSGGQKQILNLAAIMVMEPKILILDEPTSQLDPIAAKDFLDMVNKINEELGTTIIMSEHRLEEVLPRADRVVVLEEGEMLLDGSAKEVCDKLLKEALPMAKAMPTTARTYDMVSEFREQNEELPLKTREGRLWLGKLLKSKKIRHRRLPARNKAREEKKIIQGKNLWFRYDKDGEDVVKGLNVDVRQGEIFALVGGNGTGKTTALGLMAGLRNAQRGKLIIKGRTGLLPQNPESLFLEKTVRAELMEAAEGREDAKDRVEEIAEVLKISELMDRHPYDISGGEQEKLALGKVLLVEPDILLLDEPTKGLDNFFKEKFAKILQKLREQGKTIVLVSHDVEFAAKYADRCAMFFNGAITTENEPRAFFGKNSFYTTAAGRMSKRFFENAITAEDVALLCKKNLENDEGSDKDNSEKKETEQGNVEENDGKKEIESKKSTGTKNSKILKRITSILAIVMAMGTLLFAAIGHEGRGYYVVSLLMVLYMMIPFFVNFEKSRPKAREIVIVAVLVTLGVVGRSIFFAIPNFTPVLAIAIIAGIFLGPNQGFITGALIAFISNFLFGQGPWTPWQMFALGAVGLIAGFLFNERSGKIPVVIYGAISGIVYGLIVDIWTVISVTPEINLASIVMIYGGALIFDIIICISTGIFLWLLYKPVMEKLTRVRKKYGGFGRQKEAYQ